MSLQYSTSIESNNTMQFTGGRSGKKNAELINSEWGTDLFGRKGIG